MMVNQIMCLIKFNNHDKFRERKNMFHVKLQLMKSVIFKDNPH